MIHIDVYVIHVLLQFQIKIINIKKVVGIFNMWLLNEKVET